MLPSGTRLFPLRSQSLNAMAVQLPLTTLRDDVAVLQPSLARISGATVLVGHSYTGAVKTEAANGNDLIKALVYVSAMAPEQAPNATRDENALMATVQKPIAFKCFEAKISNPAWRGKPSCD